MNELPCMSVGARPQFVRRFLAASSLAGGLTRTLLIMGPMLFVLSGCSGGAPDSALRNRGTPKAEYAQDVEAAAADGVLVTCDGEGEVTFLDFHAHPNVSQAVTHVSKFPNVTMLNFSSSKLTDADLVNLKSSTKVEELGLHGTQVTDDGLDSLAGMSNLRQLNLTDTEVGDAGIAKLAALKSLVRLDLQDTNVTDAVVPTLQSLENLMYIQLSNTAVSADAMAKLSATFPDAMVINEVIEDVSGKPMLTDDESPDL